MKKKLFSLNLVILSLAALVLVPQAQAEKPADSNTIVDIASGNENFSTLVAAVVKADLIDVLSGRRQFTVFAPTNQAFDDAAAALGLPDGLALVEALDVATLTDILLYHVSPGERFSGDVLDSTRIRTMNKSFLFVNPDELMLIGTGSTAMLLAPDLIDIDADNGVIHVIDFVLLPFAI